MRMKKGSLVSVHINNMNSILFRLGMDFDEESKVE